MRLATILHIFAVLFFCCGLGTDVHGAQPLRALMIAGGCCHDYPNQNTILSKGVSQRARVKWTLVNQGGTARDVQIPIYSRADWADGFDVVVHNECFGGVDDAAWLNRIVDLHKTKGLPAVFIHCSLHSYRAADTDEWRRLMGARSMNHERSRPLKVVNLQAAHPIMKSFPPVWQTPAGELYKIMETFAKVVPLAKAFGEDSQMDHLCAWVNEYGKARVFTTTLGHHNVTMQDPVYLDMVTRGILWVTGNLQADGSPVSELAPSAK